jgi:hypothetical protein
LAVVAVFGTLAVAAVAGAPAKHRRPAPDPRMMTETVD